MNKIKSYIIIVFLQLIKLFLSKDQSICLKIRSGILKSKRWNFTKDSSNEYILGIYETDITKIFTSHVNTGDTIYDIGAHHGYFSVVFSCLSGKEGKVFSFEPFESNIQIFKKNISNNKIKNVNIFNIALSNQNGRIEFTNSGNNVANTYLKISPIFAMTTSKIIVQTNSIDVLISESMIDIPNFIKMDVEGAEFDVLEGAKQLLTNYSPIVLVATHNPHYFGVEQKVLNFMESLNYRVKESILHKNNSEMKDILFVKKE